MNPAEPVERLLAGEDGTRERRLAVPVLLGDGQRATAEYTVEVRDSAGALIWQDDPAPF